MKNNPLMKRSHKKTILTTMLITALMMVATATGILPVFATGAVAGLIGQLLNVIIDAAKYVGIIIIAWGAFQMIMAFRREDSEGISKQVITVVVGGLLLGLGGIIGSLGIV